MKAGACGDLDVNDPPASPRRGSSDAKAPQSRAIRPVASNSAITSSAEASALAFAVSIFSSGVSGA